LIRPGLITISGKTKKDITILSYNWRRRKNRKPFPCQPQKKRSKEKLVGGKGLFELYGTRYRELGKAKKLLETSILRHEEQNKKNPQ